MSAFLTPLFLRAYSPNEVREAGSSKALYVITEDFSYSSDQFGVIAVKAGLVTDFASIPREVWGILDPEDPVILYPSALHDAGYSYQGAFPGQPILSREQVDQLLREAMGISGADELTKTAVYDAVRLFGESHWSKA